MQDAERTMSDLESELLRLQARCDQIKAEMGRRIGASMIASFRHFRITAAQREELNGMATRHPWITFVQTHWLRADGDLFERAADIERWADIRAAMAPQRAHSMRLLAGKIRAIAPLVMREDPEG